MRRRERMKNNIKSGRVVRMRRGFASALLIATLATQIAPLTQVSADELDYTYSEGTPYKTANTKQYVIDINPMIGAGQVGAGETKKDIAPQGGSYQVQRVARYTLKGERIAVDESPQMVTLTSDDNNRILVDGDGEYKITPVGRIPGFLKDLGATTENDVLTGDRTVEPQGHYIYAFPLIDNGVPSGEQEVDFQPKLREARTDLEIIKLGDDQTTPLAGVTFSVYQKKNAQTNETFADGANKIGTATTGADGRLEFTNLIEGSYYFVEEGAVPDRYLPNTQKIEFDVQVAENQETVNIVATDAKDIQTVGNNIRGIQTGNTITRVNYVDPAQNKEQTYQTVKGNYSQAENTTKGLATGSNEGIVYLNTTGYVDYSSSVDIPKNFNDFNEFSVVDTVSDKLTIQEDSVALRVVGKDGSLGTYTLADLGADFTVEGQEIKINAKGSELSKHLEATGVDYMVLTYQAKVDTTEIAEGVQYETLTTSQTIKADAMDTDGVNPSGTTVHATDVRIQEGKIVVDKDANDGQQTPLEDAEFQLYRPVTEGEEAEITNDGIGWVKASNPRTKANYAGATNAEGQLEFGNLPYGEYLIVETKAPTGYRLNNEPTRVTLTEENEDLAFVDGENTVVSTIENMRRNQIFPGTGTTGNVLTLVALTVAGATLVGVTIKKRKENEENVEQA